MKKKKKPMVNLILSHVNNTFLILEPWIGPQTFRHTHCAIGKNVFLHVEKGPIQCTIWLKLTLGLLAFGPLFKMAFRINLKSLIISTIVSRNWAHLSK